jgi:hypothetical protein
VVGVNTEPGGEFLFSIRLSNWERPPPCIKSWRSERIDGTCCSSHWKGESGDGVVGSVTVVPLVLPLVIIEGSLV